MATREDRHQQEIAAAMRASVLLEAYAKSLLENGPGWSEASERARLALCAPLMTIFDDGDIQAARENIMHELRCDEDGNPDVPEAVVRPLHISPALFGGYR